jgi:hypothetical protein
LSAGGVSWPIAPDVSSTGTISEDSGDAAFAAAVRGFAGPFAADGLSASLDAVPVVVFGVVVVTAEFVSTVVDSVLDGSAAERSSTEAISVDADRSESFSTEVTFFRPSGKKRSTGRDAAAPFPDALPVAELGMSAPRPRPKPRRFSLMGKSLQW